MVKGESLETLVQDLENELKIKGTSWFLNYISVPDFKTMSYGLIKVSWKQS